MPRRSYNQIDDKTRFSLVRLITEEQKTIRAAAIELGLKYENAKAIYRVFRLERRITKIKYRDAREDFYSHANAIRDP